MPHNSFAKRSALSFSLGCLILAALLAIVAAISASAASAGTRTVTTTADAATLSRANRVIETLDGVTLQNLAEWFD